MGMNKLLIVQRAKILAMLCERSSLRSVSRLANVSIDTVSKLLVETGRFCAGDHDAKILGVKANRVQVCEIWSFVGARAKNIALSNKFWNNAHMVVIYAVQYNFLRVHQTLRVTPIMAANLSQTVMTWDDIVEIMDADGPATNAGRIRKRRYKSEGGRPLQVEPPFPSRPA
jgi:hypothetical protein